MSSTEYASKRFDKPFVWMLSTSEIARRCANCFRFPASGQKLSFCGKCRLFRYCSKQCQLEDWFHHRTECRIFGTTEGGENGVNGEVIFFGRFLHAVKRAEEDPKRSTAPVQLLRENQPILRDYQSLMTHAEDIKINHRSMQYFEAVKEGISEFFGPNFLDLNEDQIFDVFCRKVTNCHEISDNKGNRIGTAVDLGIAAYDHSCKPNIGVIYDGRTTIFRALEQGLQKVDDVNICFLSYVELMQPKEVRRNELKQKYHFDCACERCLSEEDDLLTSVKCSNSKNCQKPVLITDSTQNLCTACETPLSHTDHMRGKHKMTELQTFVESNGNVPKAEQRRFLKTCEELIIDAQKLLPSINVFLADLYCLYVQYSMMTKSNMENGILYALEALPCLRLSYPSNYKPLGFHYLKVAFLMIQLRRFKESVPYVQDALRIFKIWFGEEHAYCVQVSTLLDRVLSDDDLTNERFDQYFKF